MASTKQSTKKHEAEIKKDAKVDYSPEIKKEVTAQKQENQENKAEVSMEDKKEKKKEKKEFAIARGDSLRISTKHAIAICKIIKGKSPDAAIKRLEEVVLKKRVIPMAGREVAHQKGKGIAGAKFPKKASLEIIKMIKQVKANAIINGIENLIITKAMSNKAPTPMRRGGVQGKRTHITIEVKDKTKLLEKRV